MFIGENIRDIRKSRGMTGYELAKRLGKGTGQVSQWEQGKYVPRMDMLERIADVLDCSLSDLVESPERRGENLSAQEAELVEVWRNIGADGRQHALATLRAFEKSDPACENTAAAGSAPVSLPCPSSVFAVSPADDGALSERADAS